MESGDTELSYELQYSVLSISYFHISPKEILEMTDMERALLYLAVDKEIESRERLNI